MLIDRDYDRQDVIAIATTDDTFYVCAAYGIQVIYDHIITFSQEVELHWRPNTLSGPSVIFFTNRYLLLLYAVASVLNLPAWSTPLKQVDFTVCVASTNCEVTGTLFAVLNALLFANTALFSALRVYAISLQNKNIACMTLALGLTPFVINLYTVASQSYSYMGEDGLCTRTRHYSTTIGLTLSYVSWAGVVLADVLVVAVTWSRTYSFLRWARRSRISSPLITLCLRDGTLYFLAILLVNTIELGINQSWVHASTSTSSGSTSVSARDDWYTIVPIAPILVSRFLLHLRQVSKQGSAASSWTDDSPHQEGKTGPSKDAVATFSSRLVGNMGADLEFASFSEESELGQSGTDRSEESIREEEY